MAEDDGPPPPLPPLQPSESLNDQTTLLTPPPPHPAAEKEKTSAPPSVGETLALSPSVGSNRDGAYPSFSELLGGVMSANRVCFQSLSLSQNQTFGGPLRFEGKFEMSHLEALSTVTAEAAQDKKWMEPQAPSQKSPMTPSEVCQPSSPVSQEPSFVPRKDAHMQEMDQQNCSSLQSKDLAVIIKSPASDRFNWRKYGQKQVRSSESHRSYYRCSNSDCQAKKKVQHCDLSGRIIEVNYKGEHNHDPPQKIRCPRSRRYVSSPEAAMGSDVLESPSQNLDGPGLSVPQTREEHTPISQPMPEMERMESQDSRNSNDILSIKMEEDGNNVEARQRNNPPLKMVPRKRKRLSNTVKITNVEDEEQCGDFDPRRKESSVKYSDPLFRSLKEPKIVVHAAVDVEVSSDGYRWRKYGQKNVKGNPYPRSYYRCASAGCPVRKHVERTTEQPTVKIITYEGKHDHDMPVLKNHVPPSSAFLIEAGAAMDNVQKRTESSLNLFSPTGSPVDMEGDLAGEKASELAGEKALELS